MSGRADHPGPGSARCRQRPGAGRGDPGLRWVKVGLELFTAAGPRIVLAMRDRGLRVFLDLKFHDIPATMAGACRSAARLGAELITVHACAGSEALAAAQAGAGGGGEPGRVPHAHPAGGDGAHQLGSIPVCHRAGHCRTADRPCWSAGGTGRILWDSPAPSVHLWSWGP